MTWKNVLFSLMLPASLPAAAQQEAVPASTVNPDTCIADSPYEPQGKAIQSVYERRIEKRIRRWQRFIPSHYKAQFAGSIGAAAIGPGWTYGRHDQWETDVLIGFLPKANSSVGKAVFTLKESYIPWNIRMGRSNFTVKPLTCGLFLSSVLNSQFWVSEPDRYPSGYYGFSTRIRLNICLGQRFSYYFPERTRTYAQGISVYYELGACDTDLLTFFGDRCIPFKEILSLGIGVKVHM
ncbi:MAG: hypothetical protein NC388_07165 [Clostridium sp.]|nr:hypothetical protein [Clostridium sp.]